MAEAINIRYFDGKISKPHLARLSPIFYQGQADGFVITWQNKHGSHEQRYFIKDCEYLPAIDNSPHVLMFHDGARAELAVIPDWLTLDNKKLFGNIKKMETRWSWIGTSLIVVCLFVFGLFRYGIPTASHHLAQSLPADTLVRLGDQAEDYVMELTLPSTLPQARQDEIISLYDKLDSNPKAKILVRHGDSLGANAFAIPNNTIVITDELIKLSDDNNEILAVLAHEQGHLVHRHSLEQAISSLGLGVLIVIITGDTSDILLALPTLLTSSHYSQKAELEADRFAINELTRLGISPKHLASFFEKMQKEHGEQGHWSIISTHPDTNKRIEQVNQHSK
ncbi:M48 family metallopeptidase [Moraxella sp. ZY200743]|uniref:M48 family metallopeptidase n=1 Tax=Moraxella sp. ZY200743 TaxID=2911970 RepID=UPI003D7E46FF